MSMSKIDKRIKNARLALQRAIDAGSDQRRIDVVAGELQQAEARKQEMKAGTR